MIKNFMVLFWEPVLGIWEKLVGLIPHLIAAIFIILVGFFASRVIASACEHIFKRIKLDTWTSRVGLNEVMARVGLGKSPSLFLSALVYWFIMVVFIVSAANVLNLDFLSKVLEIFILNFLPKVIAAIIIGFAGLLLARFMENTIYNSAMANNLKGGKSFAKIINFVILVFTGILAIEQLGLDMKIIRSSINILMASLGLAFAIAVGLGAKDIARDLLYSMFSENKKEEEK
ncbi:MAG: mechanosensitive ion channel family protein [Elusimicrobia bacterium]|nr:mechanosensitive ion channel family protein [Elusimicrobiota bacterium]NLI10597.1 mechanosensitive ion channel family protein [Elusimicrobiota bacterium]